MIWTGRFGERARSLFRDLTFLWLYLRLNIPYLVLSAGLFVLSRNETQTHGFRSNMFAYCACVVAVYYRRLPWQTLPNSAVLLLHTLIRRWQPGVAESSERLCYAGLMLSGVSFFLFPLLSFAPPTGPYKACLGTRHTVWAHEQHIAPEWEAQGVGLELQPNGLLPIKQGKGGKGRTLTRRLPIQIFYPAALPSSAPLARRAARTDNALSDAIRESWRLWMQAKAPTWTTGSFSSLFELDTLLHEFAIHLFEIPSWLGAGAWLSHLWLIPSQFVYGASMLQPPVDKDGTQHKWPVVLYTHGMFGWKTFNASIAAELASHGYVVVALEHPGDSIVSIAGADSKTCELLYPPQLHSLYCHTGRNGYNFSRQNLDEQWWTYHCNLRIRHEDVLQVARRLMTLKLSDSADEVHSTLSGVIDTSSFGLYGHSYGGGTAYTATCTHGVQGPAGEKQELGTGRGQLEPRFACMVGLDPWLWPVHSCFTTGGPQDLFWGLQGFQSDEKACLQRVHNYTHSGALAQQAQELNKTVRSAPCLFLTSDGWMWRRWNMPLWQTVMARDPVHNRLLQFKGTSHINFTDAILVASPSILRLSPGNGIGSSDPLRCTALQARLACTFMQAHLPLPVQRAASTAGQGDWEESMRGAVDGQGIAAEMENAHVSRVLVPSQAIHNRSLPHAYMNKVRRRRSTTLATAE